MWTYPDCNFPIFGWPWPYRAYSECCSLEWNVDWAAYAFDMAVHLLIAVAILAILRRLFRAYCWQLNAVLWLLIVTAATWALFQWPMYHPTNLATVYPMDQLRAAGLVRSSGYGTCPSKVSH